MFLQVYTDGSATTADKAGGYGWVIVIDGEKYLEGSGHIEFASNNDAELQAAIEGLKKAHETVSATGTPSGHNVVLVSDSQIILGWASGKYRFKQEDKMGKFKELQFLVNMLGAKTRWVEGHSGDEHNERCDKLANAARLGVSVDDKPKKKRASRENKITVTYKVLSNIEILDGLASEAMIWANSGQYAPGTEHWRSMFVDKLHELLDNGNYFSIEKETL